MAPLFSMKGPELKVYLRTWLSSKPYLPFSQTQTPVSEASDNRKGWPFMSAKEEIPASGWAISTQGSFCITAITARTGTWFSAMFMATKLLEPTPRSAAPVARSWGTFEPGPPGRMFTFRPRFSYSPAARAA